MEKNQNVHVVLFLLRVSMGWLLTWAALAKIFNPEWSAAGYLKGAKTFTTVYQWFASAGNVGWVNFLNEWGVLLLGLLLLFGLFTKWAAIGGVLLMLLYYFPILKFPYAGQNSLLLDDHIIYILILILLIVTHAGQYWGLDTYLAKRKTSEK